MNSSVIYIVCPGHSGSTLLDMLLGMHEDVFSTGELVHLPNQYYRNKYYEPAPSNGMSCSCGTSFYDCGFWGEIINKLNSNLDYDIIKNPLKFKTAFLMSHEIPHQKKIHKIKRKFLQFTIKNNLHGIDKLMNSTSTKQIKNNELLFSSIHHLSNTSNIIDSTKDMYRLHYLLHSKNINIQVIVLKRSIFGVSASGKKTKSEPFEYC